MDLKEVIPGRLFRSDKPSEEDYFHICFETNIGRVINLQKFDGKEPYGSLIDYHHIPMSGLFPPKRWAVDHVLNLIHTSHNPVLVHCLKGKDRTGLIIALYRYFYQDWSRDMAYKEMLDNGFNTKLIGLKWYFKKVTNMHD